jgi:uncharacterized membrane protein
MIPTTHLHPMLVHFPIALLTFGFLAEVISLFFKKEPCLSKVGFYLLIATALTAPVAWLAGIFFTGDMTGAAGNIKEIHALFALITVVLVFVNLIFRIYMKTSKKEESKPKWIYFAIYFISFITVSITGYFGGTLVYNYMMPL